MVWWFAGEVLLDEIVPFVYDDGASRASGLVEDGIHSNDSDHMLHGKGKGKEEMK